MSFHYSERFNSTDQRISTRNRFPTAPRGSGLCNRIFDWLLEEVKFFDLDGRCNPSGFIQMSYEMKYQPTSSETFRFSMRRIRSPTRAMLLTPFLGDQTPPMGPVDVIMKRLDKMHCELNRRWKTIVQVSVREGACFL